MKRRMYSCILVIGGGFSKFEGTPEWIKFIVWTRMPKHHRVGLHTMDVLTYPKVSSIDNLTFNVVEDSIQSEDLYLVFSRNS